MSTLYSGIAANALLLGGGPESGGTLLLTTNTNPCLVQTGAPHGLITGDRVSIHDHPTNTSINGGPWVVTVLDPTHFFIPVAGIATSTGGGFWVALSAGPNYPTPLDGEDLDVASVNAAFEAFGDRTNLLSSNQGRWRQVSAYDIAADDNTTEASVLTTFTATGSPAWVNFNAFTPWSSGALSDGGNNLLQGGDIIYMHATGSVQWSSAVNDTLLLLGLGMAVAPVGASMGAQNKITGTGQRMPNAATLVGSVGYAPFSLFGRFVMPSGQSQAQPGIQIWANAASGTVSIVGDYQIRGQAYRATDYLTKF